LMGTMMKSFSKMLTDLVQRLTRPWRRSAPTEFWPDELSLRNDLIC
jgi:hypothetical protein